MYTGGMKQHITLRSRDSLARLEQVAKKARDPALKVRLKSIALRRQGKTPHEIAGLLVVTDHSVTNWINRYNEGGISALATKPSGRPEGNPKWDGDIFNELIKEIDKGGYWSIPRMQDWIAKHHQVNIPEQTVWYRMDQLNYSYKSARPHPAQGNKQKQDSFKKRASYRIWNHLE